MKTEPVPTLPTQMVVAFLIRQNGGEPEMLMGPKLTGDDVATFMMQPGGHLQDENEPIFDCCKRETGEESGLRVTGGELVAQLDVTVQETGKRKFIHFIRYDAWIGDLNPCTREFEKLEFIPYSQIPWDRFLPGDEAWMKRVLFDGRRLFTVMICGKNRMDLKSMVMYDLTDHDGAS